MKKNRKIRWETLRHFFKSAGLLFIISNILFYLTGFGVQASDIAEPVEEELLDQFEYGEIDDVLKKMFPDEKLDFKETVKAVLSGEEKFSIELLKRLVCDQFFYAFAGCRKNLVQILMITIVAAVFQNFAQVFKNRQVSEISFCVVYLLLIALCLNSFQIVMEWVSDGIVDLTLFMTVFCPVYFLAVSIAKGSITAVGFYNLILFFIYIIVIVIV